MNVYMTAYLIYSETNFNGMVLYRIMVSELQIIYMYHMDHLIKKV